MDIITQKKKTILHSLITLAIPTIIDEILSTLLQYVDTAMVGQLGEKATATVSVTMSISWLSFCLAGALSIAVQTLISQSYGRRDFESIKQFAAKAVFLGFVLGVFIEAAGILLSRRIPVWMGAEEAIRGPASTYFVIILLPFFLRSVYVVMSGAMRGIKDTKTPMLTSLLANALNVILNYLLIYVTGLGVTGAAIGSSISYVVSGVLMVIAFRRKQLLAFSRRDLGFDRDISGKLISLAIPVLGTSVATCSGHVAFSAQVSRMGTTIFAAHSIAIQAEQLFYIAGYGIKAAVSTLVGISVGEGDNRKYVRVRRAAILLTLGMQCVSGMMLFVFARPMMGIFTSSEAVRDLGALVLRIVAFSEPFYGLMIVTEGVFYGLGNTKIPFAIELIAMWAVRILPTVIYVQSGGRSLNMVWYFMIADNVSKAVALTIPLIVRRDKMFAGAVQRQ